uniref:Uncharacterized protein n=1 Tax=Leersia perrieri TaxID=77586 RepID=A0A0D9X851_9ORYZ
MALFQFGRAKTTRPPPSPPATPQSAVAAALFGPYLHSSSMIYALLQESVPLPLPSPWHGDQAVPQSSPPGVLVLAIAATSVTPQRTLRPVDLYSPPCTASMNLLEHDCSTVFVIDCAKYL